MQETTPRPGSSYKKQVYPEGSELEPDCEDGEAGKFKTESKKRFDR
ncbi:hypothetical protein LEP1GSC070_0979 [Leptospira santarosai str. AIM]|nr:hypothetical protein LEP1GSC070_0979 [Leptospira santarosai str. AIM]